MIQKLNPILEYAERKNHAIGAFTATSFDVLKAYIEIAEKRNEPIIIKHSPTFENEAPLKYMGPVIIELAKRAKVDICPMLDHATDVNYVKEGFKMGFTAVMYDGSNLPYAENVKIGNEVVDLAKAADANIEAAISVVGKDNVDEVVKFAKEVDVDCLAPLFRRDSHSEYALNFDILKEISEKTGLPLVLHGAGHLPKDSIKKAIECGVRKVNYFSLAYVDKLKKYLSDTKIPSLAQMNKIIVDAIAGDVNEAMGIFAAK